MSDSEARRDANALEAFTKRRSTPRTTFALVLVSIAEASLSMALDDVERYSTAAFMVGIALAAALAFGVGRAVDVVKDATWRAATALLLPGACGALIGMLVQAIVLAEVGSDWNRAVKDLGGLVDTTEPVGWIAAGVVLGGLPAVVVSVFLFLAARALTRVAGHDASESFGVGFVGVSGLISAFGLLLVRGLAQGPLFLVTVASAVTVLVAVVIDGSRIAFLRRVYAKNGEGFDIVPADRFAADPNLAPMVAAAGSSSVLVRVHRGDYRASALEPVALVADTEQETLRPLLRRRAAGAALLAATAALAGLAVLVHA
ncbi:MAG: hypothetical protein KIT84_37230 [Labilithrix sp.]|nr:hypothetical protein [Labilithrix sp.]MCW5816702.1 hypothetical protein [Labilithrix sp.]